MQDILKPMLPIILAHVAILAVLVMAVKRLLLKDTLNAVKRIQNVEVELRKKEDGIRREIQGHEKAFARQKVEAEDELQRHKAQAEKELTRLRDQMLAEAKKESDRIVDQAHKNEERLRQKIAQEMEEKTVTHAAEIFKAVFSARVNQQVNREFNEELVAAFEALDGESITIDADEGEIRTSQPMEAEQKKRLEELLVRKFHRPVRLVERIDPDLLSGLVLKLGSLEIDGSLRNRLEEAVQEVTKGASAA